MQALLALILVSLVCGAVGSLVVGGRMAFFSDALAHCAFAGISLGFVFFEAVVAGSRPSSEFWGWVTPVMICFGALVGAGIAYVRGNSGLSSDTVIGVFFAASVGLAGALRKLIHNRNLFNLEDFLFGDPLLVGPGDLVNLLLLALLTALVLGLTFNRLLLAGFNPSLALSRRVPVTRDSYLVIILLALIVNLCLRSIGVLLINALLVVPAATAVNLSTNLRQVFWLSVGVCLVCCVGGHLLSWELGAGLASTWACRAPWCCCAAACSRCRCASVRPCAVGSPVFGRGRTAASVPLHEHGPSGFVVPDSNRARCRCVAEVGRASIFNRASDVDTES